MQTRVSSQLADFYRSVDNLQKLVDFDNRKQRVRGLSLRLSHCICMLHRLSYCYSRFGSWLLSRMQINCYNQWHLLCMFIKESKLIRLTNDLKTCLIRNNLGPYNPSPSKTHLFCSNCEQVVDWRKCCEMQLRTCFNLIFICSGDYDCSRIFSICNDFEMANCQLKTVDARFFVISFTTRAKSEDEHWTELLL